ncbi:MFS transporter [Priestia megaterium]|nr:MFS transporter [Priestia megaterium]
MLMAIALFVAALNMRPAINSISPLLEELRSELHMSASTASLLTSVPVLCMGLFSPLSASLGKRFGMERVIGAALILIGIGTLLRLFTYTTGFLIMTAFLAGVGIAAIGPLLSGFIKKHFDEKVPAIISLYTVALTLGAVVSSWLSVPLFAQVQSWKGTLAVWTVFAVIAIPVWWLFVLKNQKDTRFEMTYNHSVHRIPWKNKKAWLLTLSFGCMAMIFYSVTAWLPPIIESKGYSKMYAGNMLTLFTAVQIPVSVLLPSLLQRFPSRLLWLLFAACMEAVGFMVLLLGSYPFAAAVFIGIGAGTLFPLNLMLPIDVSADADQAAAWSAMTQSFGYIIGAIGPLVIGLIYDVTKQFNSAIFFLLAMILCMMIIQVLAITSLSRKSVYES